MDWLNQIGNVLQQYTGANPHQAPASADEDYDRVTQAAPRPSIADGLATAFRSDQTPPFAQMVEQLFRNAPGEQRAGLLNTLIAAVGPGLVAQILGQRGLGSLAGLLGGGQKEVTPEQAEQVPPEAVRDVAAQAEEKNPSVIDWISDFMAENPGLVKTLGTAALTMIMSRVAQRHQAA